MTQFRGAVDLSTLSSKPSAPASGYHRLYPKSDNRLYMEGSAGSEYPVTYPAGWGPIDHGLLSWTYDPVMITTGQSPNAGSIYLGGHQVIQSGTVSTIYWVNTTAASGTMTPGQCQAALLDSTGTVLVTADISSLSTAQFQSVSVTPTAITPGFYWVGFLWNGTSSFPQMARCSTTSMGAMNINRGNLNRFALNGTSQSTITNRTPANNTNSGAFSIWSAIG